MTNGSAVVTEKNLLPGISVRTVMKARGTAIKAEIDVTKKAKTIVFTRADPVRFERRSGRASNPTPTVRMER